MNRPTTKRLTRKDIRQPDRFIDFMAKSGRFLKEQKKLVAGLVIVVAALWGWSLYQQRENETAAGKYFQALALYRTGNYREAVPALTQLSAHRRSIYGRMALLHLAHSQTALGQDATAAETLKEFIRRNDREPGLRQIGYVNLGYIQEKSGKCVEALVSFAEAQKLEGSLKDEATLGQARCNAQSGKPKIAIDFYRQYLSTHPASGRNGEISLKIQELEAAITPAKNGK